MSTATLHRPTEGVLRRSTWDAVLVLLAIVQVGLPLALPIVPVVAIGLWWNANTISHFFIHRPFFRSRILNALFSLHLSLLLGFPHVLWRERHLAHHAGVPYRFRWSRRLVVETLSIAALWVVLILSVPEYFFLVYLPGYVLGLWLCALHGHYEHARGTTSHHGRLYNLLFLNDGYHVEHHEHPSEHWSRLPAHARSEMRLSRWPAVLRWLDAFSLDGLERLVIAVPILQRFVLNRHERAFRAVLPDGTIHRVLIVGGGLYPRTLLVLRRLLPTAELTLLDAEARHLETARRFAGEDVRCVHAWYDPAHAEGYDLVVFPLAYRGDRDAILARPPARFVVVHDWLWARRGTSVVVSYLLLKRLNITCRDLVRGS